MKNEGTVTIGLKEYNELRDFKNAMGKGKTVQVITDATDLATYQTFCFYYHTDAVELVLKENRELKKDNDSLRHENFILKTEIAEKTTGGLFFWK